MPTGEFKGIFLASDIGTELTYKVFKFGNLEGRPHSPVRMILYFVSMCL